MTKSIHWQSSNGEGISPNPICFCVICRSASHWPPAVLAVDCQWSRTAHLLETWSCCWAGQGVRGCPLPRPPQHRGLPPWHCGGRSDSPTIPSGEDLGFPSSLPLLYTMMCSSRFNSCFSFSVQALLLLASYGSVLCMIKSSLQRIALLSASSCCYCTL
jgi:hypothetical protein